MFFNSNYQQLETLKTLVLFVAGIANLTVTDCATLVVAIKQKTNLTISESTIRHLFGFAKSKFSPSVFTLNVLSIYCGYDDWMAFCKSETNNTFSTVGKHRGLFSEPLFWALLETSTPTIILNADALNATIITYNKAFEVATYTQKRKLIGLSIWQAFDPEKAGGSGPTTLLEAFHDVISKQQPVNINSLQYNIPSFVPNSSTLSWWDVKITPVVYDGACKYFLINLKSITERILNQEDVEQAILRELTMAEDLAMTNVKLSKAIDELAKSHEELTRTKNQLEELNEHLEQRVFERTERLLESETRQRQLIDNAPVAIAVLRGADHVIETANKKIIEYWGKDSSVTKKSLLVALPELEGQPFIAILDQVRDSGIAYRNPELHAFLNINGTYQPRYFDMIYQPVQHQPGITDSIYVVAVDITESVFARRNLEISEQTLRIAVTAANIGIWSFKPEDRILNYSPTFAKILGWDSEVPMTIDQAMAQIPDDYRNKIRELIQSATETGEQYNFTYAHVRFKDSKLIYVQSIGKITTYGADRQLLFSGVLKQVP